MKIRFIVLLLVIILSCKNNQSNPQGGWIKRSEEEKIKTIEKHLRGFDMAMIEVDYRYQELFWAGKDNNWDHAYYQLDKIKLTIENAQQRRPKRTNSAEDFLKTVLPEMKKSLEAGDSILFNKNFIVLTAFVIAVI
ncbi:MAG TPA: hypothetical protein VFH08_07530 [Chitinophagaceae bacterium]|nr:hypothetical protein [Chitinophagaceae bacterium]